MQFIKAFLTTMNRLFQLFVKFPVQKIIKTK